MDQNDYQLLNHILDSHGGAAYHLGRTVGMSISRDGERLIRQEHDAIPALSTPVWQVRDRLLIVPMMGPIDSRRARQLTEQLLRGISRHRAKVVVVDITGVPTIDSTGANHLVQMVVASGLMGAHVIITGLSSEIAQTLVTIGVDLSKVNAVVDLESGLKEAERWLGYPVSDRAGVLLPGRRS